MIPAIAMSMLPELIKIVESVVKDPDTYKKLEAIRQFLCKVTGKEIPTNAVAEFLEVATQGEPFTGEWEPLQTSGHRMRVAGGYLYDIGRGNAVFVADGGAPLL